MSNIEKISTALTQDMLATVKDAIASGDYATSSEVVRDALRDWKLRRTLEQWQIDDVRRLVDEGIASGFKSYDGMEAIKAEGRGRLAAQAKNLHELAAVTFKQCRN
jgi:antitoxin ParD1/3/4